MESGMELMELLKQHSPFKVLTNKDGIRLSRSFTAQEFGSGENILSTERPAFGVGIIKSGTADLRFQYQYNENRSFASLKTGDFFGVIPLFTEGEPIISAISCNKICCWMQDRDGCLTMLKRFPQIKDYFYHIAIQRIWDVCKLTGSATTGNSQYLQKCINQKQDVISRALSYINNNYMLPLALDGVAKEIGMSKFHFSRLFKSHAGYSFKEYLNICRIHSAKKMLQEEQFNVSEICYEVGYNDASYFCRVFQKYEGMSPINFRKSKHRK